MATLHGVKSFLEACYWAKRLTEKMPALPKGMTSRHILVIEVLYILSQDQPQVRVSDISDYLKVTKPSITKLLNELETLQVVQKIPDSKDKRVIHVQLTQKGNRYYAYYVQNYQNWLTEQWSSMDDQDLLTAADTIIKAYQIMNEIKEFPLSLKEE